MLAVWLWALPQGAAAQLVLRDGFEGPAVSWRIVQADVHYRLELHRRTTQSPREGQWCEELRLTAGNGTLVHAALDLTPARVIEELEPALWLRANRKGLQLLAVVRLPRTVDPQTGKPALVILGGDSYQGPGRWEQLRVRNLPLLLQRRARLLRLQWKRDVDTREAQLVQLRVNAYGGPGTTHLWLDGLSVAGFVAAGAVQPQVQPVAHRSQEPTAAPERTPPRVQRRDDRLLLQGRSFVLRAIRYRGESLSWLKQRGFNTLWLDRVPDEALNRQAARHGLWLVAPPPLGKDAPGVGLRPADLKRRFSQVIAWDLGHNLSGSQYPAVRQWGQQLRAAAGEDSPLLIASPREQLRTFSRHLDVLYLDRKPIGTSLELSRYFRWLLQRRELSLPGTPFWITVQTQSDPALIRQTELLLGYPPQFAAPEPEHLVLQTLLSVGSGSRGVVFDSQSRLDASHVAARQRAAAVELCLMYLRLAEPWLRSGRPAGVFAGQVAGAPGTKRGGAASAPKVLAAAVRIDRGMLLVPLWLSPGAQCVPGQSRAPEVSFLVAGVPETYDAFELSPVGLRRLPRRRVTGGVRVTVERLDTGSLIVLTQDPLVIDSLSRFARSLAPRGAELRYRWAAAKWQRVQWQLPALRRTGLQLPETPKLLAQAQSALLQAQVQLEARNYEAAWDQAARAASIIRLLQRAHWEQVLKNTRWPTAMPMTAAMDLLPLAAEFRRQAPLGSAGPNQLPGGDCEELQRMLQAGWRHYREEVPGVHSLAELSPEQHHTGQYALRLRVWPQRADQPPAVLPKAPVWITTAPVAARAGQRFRLRFWVRIRRPITGSADGLLVIDSLGGESLAWRGYQTKGWQQVVLYRAASAPGPVTLTFALTGLGEVWIDDVQIEPLPPVGMAPAAAAPAPSQGGTPYGPKAPATRPPASGGQGNLLPTAPAAPPTVPGRGTPAGPAAVPGLRYPGQPQTRPVVPPLLAPPGTRPPGPLPLPRARTAPGTNPRAGLGTPGQGMVPLGPQRAVRPPVLWPPRY